MEECEENLNLSNKKIIHTFPVSFRLDGKEILGRLEGAHGTKLETKTLCITYSIQHLEDLIGALAEAGIETIEVIASPVSSANIVLSEKQKIAGVALVNIGSETTTIAVFENGGLVSVYTFSIGSGDVTNDIALGLKITLEDAENIKQGNVPENLSKKKLDEIIEARLSDIFELIENHLKKIKRSGLLPAGIVFVGGGANIRRLEELSKSILKLPSSLGTTEFFGNSKTKLRDGAWFTALGLILNKKDEVSYSSGSLNHLFKDLKETLKSSIKQLMP
jgi:cell division protein FtsA